MLTNIVTNDLLYLKKRTTLDRTPQPLPQTGLLGIT